MNINWTVPPSKLRANKILLPYELVHYKYVCLPML